MQDSHDVTARLLESEARYRAFIENASDMIQSVRPDGTFEFVNRAWLRKMGYVEAELPQLRIWDIIHPDARPHCQELFMRVMQGQAIHHVEAVFVGKEGQPFPVEGDARPRIVDGAIVATHSFFRDISERVRARELEMRNAQLEQERRARYLEKMAALGKLSAGLSHELNNPASAAGRAGDQLAESLARRDRAMRALVLAGISPDGWTALESLLPQDRSTGSDERDPLETNAAEEKLASWLETRGLDRAWEIAPRFVRLGIDEPMLTRALGGFAATAVPDAVAWVAESIATRELADVISRSTQRVAKLVGAVKSYSHMDRATETQVDVHDGLEDTLIILGHRLKGMTIQRRYDRSLPRIRAFGNSLNQVWTNIIDNAVDATGGRGTVTLATRRDGGQVLVEIADDGEGIAPEHVTRIFEPFFSTKRQGQGVGLGLDTAWRIVTEEHGGTIDVDSQPGRTTFAVRLPVSN